jgi:hypothetical protein
MDQGELVGGSRVDEGSPQWHLHGGGAGGGATVLDRWQGRGARGTGRRVVGCSGEPIAGVGRARGRLVRAVDGRCSVAGE